MNRNAVAIFPHVFDNCNKFSYKLLSFSYSNIFDVCNFIVLTVALGCMQVNGKIPESQMSCI